jgi:polyribonucleotide nucleotidyltransferase
MNPATMFPSSFGIPMTVQQQPEFSTGVLVHPDHVGYIIGAGGHRVMGIARQTETWIRIQEPNEWSQGMPWFVIKGREEARVFWAFQLVCQVAQEAEHVIPRWSYFEALKEQASLDMEEEDAENYEEYLEEPAHQMNEIYNEAIQEEVFVPHQNKDPAVWMEMEQQAHFLYQNEEMDQRMHDMVNNLVGN